MSGRRRLLAFAAVAAVVAVAVLARSDGQAPVPPPTPSVTASAPVPTQTPPPAEQADTDFPDPTVIRAGDRWYAYGSYGPFTDGSGIQVRTSTDLATWTPVGPGLQGRPAWVTPTGDWQPWAPSVLATPAACPGVTTPGCFVLFYTGLRTSSGPPTHCVAVATSSTPEGPFRDRGPLTRADGATDGGDPIGCADAKGYGNIDPSPFVDDDGRTSLYVSTDWDCAGGRAPGQAAQPGCRLKPTLSVIPLSADGLVATGDRAALFAGAPGWQSTPAGPVVENPTVVKRGGTYELLFSGGSFLADYGMGHATGPSPVGPFTQDPGDPWLASTPAEQGIGGGSVFTGPDGGPWLAYHARRDRPDAARRLRTARLDWPPGRPPALAGP